MKREFKMEVALSIATGRLLCPFSDMHECIEFLAGEPVFTHQLAYRPFYDELQAAVKAQVPSFEDPRIAVLAFGKLLLLLDSCTEGNAWNLILGWLSSDVYPICGETVSLVPMKEARNIAASFTEPLKDKDVLFLGIEGAE